MCAFQENHCSFSLIPTGLDESSHMYQQVEREKRSRKGREEQWDFSLSARGLQYSLEEACSAGFGKNSAQIQLIHSLN